ncbi:MAG: hypothetical protein RML93_03820, partial [Anaerolineales bacterium]|nr:hypothetical protein [Anaerolineales bacterium]MDW8446404.1 hypothetical protein [Anaerolineales bacterium]
MSEAGLYKRFQALLKRYNLRVGDIPLWLAGLIVAVMWIAPFVWMVSTSLKPPKEVLTKEI